MVDGRRGRWISFDASFFDGTVGEMILERFGPAGVTLFVAFLCACKRNAVQGQIEYGSVPDAMSLMGIPGLELVNAKGDAWDLQSFWRALAAHKQCSTSRRGRLIQVKSSKWAKWQEGFASQKEAQRKSRSRAPKAPDDAPPIQSSYPADTPPELETELETETETENSLADKPPKRATAAPDTFPLDDDLRAWAAEHVPTVSDEMRLFRETAKFLDHHRAKGSTMKDWRAAWRNWMLRAVEYGPKPEPVNGLAVRRVSASDDAITRVFAQLPRGEG